MAEFIYTGDEHLLLIKFNNSHAKNHFKKEFEKILRDSQALTEINLEKC